MGKVKSVLNGIMNVLLWIIVVLVAFFAIVTFATKEPGKVSSLGGYTPMTVLTDSMAPVFAKNDLIVVHAENAADFQVGDIIAFWTVIENRQVINTHRVVERIETGEGDGAMVQYVTAGDANNGEVDPYVVSPGDIVGAYRFRIPLLGKILAVLSTGVGFFLIVLLPLIAFFVYQLYRMIALSISLKKATILEATREAMEKVKQEQAAASETDAEDPKE